jgi:hypothetical protein
MTSAHFFITEERGAWLERATQIVRDVTLQERAMNCRTMPEALEQGALALGISTTRHTDIFYRRALAIRYKDFLALLRSAEARSIRRAEILLREAEKERAARHQYQAEMERVIKCGPDSHGSARGAADSLKLPLLDGKSGPSMRPPAMQSDALAGVTDA